MYLLAIYLCALRSPFLRRLHLGERLKTTAPAARVAATRTAAKSFGGWGRSIKNLSIGKVGHFYPPWNWQQKHLKIDSWNITLPETNIAHENPIFPGFHTIKMMVHFPWRFVSLQECSFFLRLTNFQGRLKLLVSGSLLPTFFKESKLIMGEFLKDLRIVWVYFPLQPKSCQFRSIFLPPLLGVEKW